MLRGTSKPWVLAITPRLSQGRALKERRRGGKWVWGCAVHGGLLHGTRSPAPFQGATLAQEVRRAADPGLHSPRLAPPWAESFAPLVRQGLFALH